MRTLTIEGQLRTSLGDRFTVAARRAILAELGVEHEPHDDDGRRELSFRLERSAASVEIPAVASYVLGKLHGLLVVHALEIDELRLTVGPAVPELWSLTDLARAFGLSRQHANELSLRPGFPEPVGEPATGRVWRADELREWVRAWRASSRSTA